MPMSNAERAKLYRDNLRKNDNEALRRYYKRGNDRKQERLNQNGDTAVQRNFNKLLKEQAKERDQVTKQQRTATRHTTKQQQIAATSVQEAVKQTTKQQKIATEATTTQQKAAGIFTTTSGNGSGDDELSIPRKEKASRAHEQAPSLISEIVSQCPNERWRQRGEIVLPLTHEKRTIEINLDEDECVTRWTRETLHKLIEKHIPGVRKGDFGVVLEDVMRFLHGKTFKQALRSLNVQRNNVNHYKWGYTLKDRAYFVETFRWVLNKLAPGYEIVHRNKAAEEVEQKMLQQLDDKNKELDDKNKEIAMKDATIASLLRQIEELKNNQAEVEEGEITEKKRSLDDEDDVDEDDDFDFDPTRLGVEEDEDECAHVDKRQRLIE